jgi:uncharacterized protein (TIGR03000 family)
MRRLRLIFFTFTAAALASAMLSVRGQSPTSATIVVTLPANARLYFNDVLTNETGPTRTFATPALESGVNYTYQLKVEVVRGGQTLTQTRKITVRAGQTTRVDFSDRQQPALSPETAGSIKAFENDGRATDQRRSASRTGSDAQDEQAGDPGWPRKITSDANTLTVYQPQAEKWEGNLLTARAAVSVETRASPQPTYGVVWFTARTEVDRESRQVTLDEFKIPKVNFPSAPDKADQFLAILQTLLPAGSRIISLDRLQANLAITQAESRVRILDLKNPVPRILFSTTPAVLVLVDGKPALRQVPGSRLLRVVNTRALILLDETTGRYYLHAVDRWMQAASVDGPWTVAEAPPASVDSVLKQVGDDTQVDLLDDPAPQIKDALEDGQMPTVYVSTEPAELLETQGEPDFAPIDGTRLLWAKNTDDDIVMDTRTNSYYVLLSGRWFRSKSLKEGPWEFVAGNKLPDDFAKIPENHPRGDVLASVSGTSQANESVIANQIPQTATVKRSETTLSTTFDGDPQFEPIEETSLQYAVNSPTPVIQVSPDRFYAVENGVWFAATSPNGPWAVAASVPSIIYTIPPSSPVYYATYVQVYNASPEYVYVGYTPGYFGTCLASWRAVIYGTGWRYRPWIGRVWYGRPWSYGYGAGINWSAAGGWSYGFHAALGRPWWGPVGWNSGWGGVWRQGWGRGWGGRYAGMHASSIHVNNFNVYNRWRTNSIVNTRSRNGSVARGTSVTAARNLNNVYAGREGGVYRRAEGGWESHTATGAWRRADERGANLGSLNREFNARRAGEFQARSFRNAGSFAGYGGIRAGGGGYRGGGGRRR